MSHRILPGVVARSPGNPVSQDADEARLTVSQSVSQCRRGCHPLAEDKQLLAQGGHVEEPGYSLKKQGWVQWGGGGQPTIPVANLYLSANMRDAVRAEPKLDSKD